MAAEHAKQVSIKKPIPWNRPTSAYFHLNRTSVQARQRQSGIDQNTGASGTTVESAMMLVDSRWDLEVSAQA